MSIDYRVPLRSFITAVLSEAPKGQRKNKAAGVLIVRNDKALCVSRGLGSDQWGFPCGKVEPGETYTEAAIRELKEETGLTLTNPKEIFRGPSTHGFEVAMFIGDISGVGQSSDEGDLGWKKIEDMLDPEISPYAEYTAKMLEDIDI